MEWEIVGEIIEIQTVIAGNKNYSFFSLPAPYLILSPLNSIWSSTLCSPTHLIECQERFNCGSYFSQLIIRIFYVKVCSGKFYIFAGINAANQYLIILMKIANRLSCTMNFPPNYQEPTL